MRDLAPAVSDAYRRAEELLARIPESEVFLFCGQMTNGDLALDRKDTYGLIKTFLQTFTGKPNKPALLLKTNGVNTSTFDRSTTILKFQQIQDELNIHDVHLYLLHGEMTETQMAALYSHKKIIANVSFTHGEGAGLPLLEASLCGLPIIVSNWSGLLDYVDDRATLLPVTVNQIEPALESEYFVKGSSWATVDYDQAKEILLKAHQDSAQPDYRAKALSLAQDNAKRFSLAVFDRKFYGSLNSHLGIK